MLAALNCSKGLELTFSYYCPKRGSVLHVQLSCRHCSRAYSRLQVLPGILTLKMEQVKNQFRYINFISTCWTKPKIPTDSTLDSASFSWKKCWHYPLVSAHINIFILSTSLMIYLFSKMLAGFYKFYFTNQDYETNLAAALNSIYVTCLQK